MGAQQGTEAAEGLSCQAGVWQGWRYAKRDRDGPWGRDSPCLRPHVNFWNSSSSSGHAPELRCWQWTDREAVGSGAWRSGPSGPWGNLGKSFPSPGVSASECFTEVYLPYYFSLWRERWARGWGVEEFGRGSAWERLWAQDPVLEVSRLHLNECPQCLELSLAG